MPFNPTNPSGGGSSLTPGGNSGDIQTNDGAGGLGSTPQSTFLKSANNLSDVANANTSRTNITAAKSGVNSDITSLTGLTTALSVAQGGTGTTTPSLQNGTNISITGAWPNQTINATTPAVTPGGSNGDIQYNNSGALGGLTIVPVANGGTGQSTIQAALNALAGAVTNNRLLAGDGTNVTLRALASADIPGGIVSLSKLQNAGANSVLLGAGNAGNGNSYSELTLGNGLTMGASALSVSFGSAADAKAGTDNTKPLSSQNVRYTEGAAKVLVTFTSVTTTAITRAVNVTSLTDNGTGDTTITFTIPFLAATYHILESARSTATGLIIMQRPDSATYNATTTTYRTLTQTTAAVNTDTKDCMIAIFGPWN